MKTRLTRIALAACQLILWLPHPGRAAGLPERELIFPNERALGSIYVREEPQDADKWYSEGPWKFAGIARGSIRVPAGHEARLEVSQEGVRDLSPLASFSSVAIQSLILRDLGRSDDQMPWKDFSRLRGLRELRLSGNPLTDACIEQMEAFPRLRRIVLNDTQIDDTAIARLSAMNSVEELGLYRTRITDKALEHLGRMDQLKSLDLLRTRISDAGLAHLIGLNKLTDLRISECNLTDRGLAFVSAISSLRRLDCNGIRATDVGLGYLAHLSRLEHLDVRGQFFTDPGVAQLSRMPALQALLIDGRLTDGALAGISAIKSLKRLWIRCRDEVQVDFTDEGLRRLSTLPHLEEFAVNVVNSTVTVKGLAALGRITTLKKLSLTDVPLGREGLLEILTLTNLEELDLSHTRLRFDDLETLKDLMRLQRLSYSPEKRWAENSPTLKSIGRISSLTRLQLPSVQFASGEFENLVGLTNLETLHFGGPVSEQDARHLGNLVRLRELYLEDPGLNDAGLAHLSRLSNLEWLEVGGEITDHGLQPLAKLNNLQALYLNSQTVTSQELNRLKEQLPRLYRLHAPAHPHFNGESPEPSLVGHPAPVFDVVTVDGRHFKLSEHRSQPVLVYFWATWCGPCVRGMPQRKQFYENLKARHERFEMVSLSVDSDKDDTKWKRFVEQHGLKWPQARIGPGSKIADAYRVLGAGYYFLVGPNGVILSDSDDLKVIQDLIAALENPGL